MPGRKFLISTFLLLAISLGSGTVAGDRPQFLEFAPAYPKTLPPFFPGTDRPRMTLEQSVEVWLAVDLNGKVIEVTPEIPQDTPLVHFAASYLKALGFEPARSGMEAKQSLLPIRIQMSPKVASPDFYFPIDTASVIADPSLYVEALIANDVYPARLTFFPAYFCPFKSDTSASYDFVLLRLNLDEAGKITNLEIDQSTCPACDWLTLSAAQYARFSPARVGEMQRPSEVWLLVSLFPQLSYPTSPWIDSDSSGAKWLDRYQVRLFPGREGLLSPPLPRFVPADNCPIAAVERLDTGPVAVAVRIDSLGRTAVRRSSGGDRQSVKAVSQYVKKLKFYPALNLHGKAIPFDGLLTFEKMDKQTVRITYSWLPYLP